MNPDAAGGLMQDARLSWHPDDWELKRLAEVCHVHNQLRKPLNDAERQQMQGPYPYFGPTSQVDSISEFRLDGVYALIGEDGDHFLKYDRMSMTQLIAGKSNVNNHAHILEGSDSCCTEWLFHFFRHRNIVHFLSRQGAGRYKLNKQALLRLPVLVPPLPEQRKIVDILSMWDRAIDLTEKLLAANQQRKAALMQQLLTGKVRLPGFDGSWSCVPLKHLVKLVKRPVIWDDSAIYKLASVRRHSQGLFLREEIFGHEIKVKKLHRLNTGDFLISDIQAAYGAMAIVPAEFEGTFVSDQYTVLAPIDGTCFDIRLLGFFSETVWFRHQIRTSCNGIMAERLRLLFDADVLLDRTLPIAPTRQEQEAIADVLIACDREIELQSRKLDALRRQKKGLMQQLLTGKVRVTSEPAPEDA